MQQLRPRARCILQKRGTPRRGVGDPSFTASSLSKPVGCGTGINGCKMQDRNEHIQGVAGNSNWPEPVLAEPG